MNMFSLTRWQRPDLSGWPRFGQLSDLRDEIDRLFESPLSQMSQASRLLSGWTPAIDVSEDKDNFYVHVEVPGMKKEDIELSLHEDCLSISGERKVEKNSEGADVYRAERFFGRFQRTVSLPAAVDTDKVKAQYRDGILSVTLPKAEEAKPKQIDVHVS
jgi:HSP20 family protein